MSLFNWQETRVVTALATRATSSEDTVWQAALLAVVGGYADAVGFLNFNAFAGAMTGNTVLLGIALATGKFVDAAQSAAIIAAFLVGVAASAWLRRWLSLAAIIVIEMTALVMTALMTQPLATSLVLAFAMGLQNAALQHSAGASVNTVFVTGNLNKLVQVLLSGEARRTAEHAAVRAASHVWLAYLTGAVLGAAASQWRPHPLLFALLPLPLVLLRRSAWRAGD